MKKLLLITLLILLLFPMVYCETKESDGLPDLIPYRKGDKWGFCDKDKNIVIECKYDETFPFEGNLAKVILDDKKGCINKKGEEVIPIKYDDISCSDKGYYFVNISTNLIPADQAKFPTGFNGIYDKDGNIQLPANYIVIHIIDKDKAFLLTKDLKWKLATIKGETIKEIKNVWIIDVEKGYALVNKKGNYGKWGMIDSNGNIVIEPKYDYMKFPKEGLVGAFLEIRKVKIKSWTNKKIDVKIDVKFGALNLKGEIVIPFEYDNACNFSEGLARLSLNGKYGFINQSGEEVIPFKYDWACDFSEGLSSVILNGKAGYINKYGKEVIPIKFEIGRNFSNGLATVKLDGKYGYINKQGKVVIPCKFENTFDFLNGLAIVKLDGKSRLINKQGKVITSKRYDVIYWDVFNPNPKVKLNNKYGLLNKEGKEITPIKYDWILKLSNDAYGVGIDKKWGFININGKEIIPIKFKRISHFQNGLAKVKLNGKWGYIDKQGNEYWED